MCYPSRLSSFSFPNIVIIQSRGNPPVICVFVDALCRYLYIWLRVERRGGLRGWLVGWLVGGINRFINITATMIGLFRLYLFITVALTPRLLEAFCL